MASYSKQENSTEMCTVGMKTIAFWDSENAKSKKNGSFGGKEQTNLACVIYDDHGYAFTGAQNGSVIKWKTGSIV